jgi:predicted nucleotidyltransferase
MLKEPLRETLFRPRLPTIFSKNIMAQPDIYQLIHLKRAEITLLAGKYGASHIRLFGSVARHTADEKSDIDFLVDLAPGKTLFDLGGFAYDLEKLLERPVDVCTVPLLREPIRSRVVREAIPL